MARRNLKAGALTAPLPPVLVTVGEGEKANIITVGWTGILATHPARTYVSVRPERYSYGLLRRHGEFVINLATVDMAKKVDYCGIYTGAKVDKFKECGFTPIESKEVSVPSIAECPLSIECRVVEVIPMGTHDVFIADIVGVSCDEEILDEAGRLCFDRANLLAYAHGEYYALGEKVGKFGFSTDKGKGGKPRTDTKKSANPTAQGAKAPTAADKTDGSSKSTDNRPANKSNNQATSKSNNQPISKANGRSANKTASEAKGGKGAKTDDGHRPFYLDAPRGKNKKMTAKKGGRSAKGGKRK